MKKKSAFHSVHRNFREGGFFKLRILFGVLLWFAAVTIVLFALQSLSTTTDAGSPNPYATERIPCGEQDGAMGDGTNSKRAAGRIFRCAR